MIRVRSGGIRSAFGYVNTRERSGNYLSGELPEELNRYRTITREDTRPSLLQRASVQSKLTSLSRMEIQLSLLHLLFEDDRRAASHVGLDSDRACICGKKKGGGRGRGENAQGRETRDGIVGEVAKCEVSAAIPIQTICIVSCN